MLQTVIVWRGPGKIVEAVAQNGIMTFVGLLVLIMWKTQHQDPARKQSAIVTTSLGSGHFIVTAPWPKQFSSSFTLSASSWQELLNEQEEVLCEQLRHLSIYQNPDAAKYQKLSCSSS